MSQHKNILSQLPNDYPPLLTKLIDYLFIQNNVEDQNKIKKWIILIIDRLKNQNDKPIANLEKIKINENLNFVQYLQQNKKFFVLNQKQDIILLFKVINANFSAHWILWDFSESLQNPLLFLSVLPTLYKSFICKYCQNSDNSLNLFKKKCQFELIVDRFIPLISDKLKYFKEKIIFSTFLFDEMIRITSVDFYELINNHLKLLVVENNEHYPMKKIIRTINNSISIFDHDFNVILNFFKVTVTQKIAEVSRQLIIFNLFITKYKRIQKTFKINVNEIKKYSAKTEYISFIRKVIEIINGYKENILLAMIKAFSKENCPHFHFPMLHFINNNSFFEKEIFDFSEKPDEDSQKNEGAADQLTNEIDLSIQAVDLSNEEREQTILEMSELLKFNQIKDHFSFTKLAFALSDQGIYDHNDILTLVETSNKCRRVFSALSIQKLLRISSSDRILHRTVTWTFLPLDENPEAFPDRMFGCAGVVTVIVFFIMRAIEFLIVSSIPKKYRTKQQLTTDTLISLYNRACKSLKTIAEKEKIDAKSQTISSSSSIELDIADDTKENDEIAVDNNKENNGFIDDDIDAAANPAKESFDESEDESSSSDKRLKLLVKRGFSLIKSSIEIGASIMDLFNVKNQSFAKNDVKKVDLMILIDRICELAKKKKRLVKSAKKVVQLEMINIGFAILNKARFDIAACVFFRQIINELTRIPVQKYDMKNMCANFEPEFPLRKVYSDKYLFLKIQNQEFYQKAYENQSAVFPKKTIKKEILEEAAAEDKPVIESEKIEDNLCKKAEINDNDSQKIIINPSNLVDKLLQKKNVELDKKTEGENKKVTENDQ